MVKETIDTVKTELTNKKKELKELTNGNGLNARDIRQYTNIKERLERPETENGSISDITVRINDTDVKVSEIINKVIEENTKEIDDKTKTKVSEIRKEISELEKKIIKMVTE